MVDGLARGGGPEGSPAGDDIPGIKRMELADETDDFRYLVVVVPGIVLGDQFAAGLAVNVQFIRVRYLVFGDQPRS